MKTWLVKVRPLQAKPGEGLLLCTSFGSCLASRAVNGLAVWKRARGIPTVGQFVPFSSSCPEKAALSAWCQKGFYRCSQKLWITLLISTHQAPQTLVAQGFAYAAHKIGKT